ncbi:armadillo repeat-containing protein 10 isoform X2 [Phyllobates terribilis]|uniref:armadillo repeat-containing protein 10 isoform X2 n=1 Tax=Phyllobates terribilis TaxID=111132 RepID=UPI003CCB4D0E
MSHAGKMTAARSLLTAALGAGVCYCLYRALSARRKKCGSGAGLRDGVTAGGHWSPEFQFENIPQCAGNLEAHHLESLLQLLSGGGSDSSAVEQIFVTLCNSAAFSVNHDIIRSLDGLRIIGGFLSHPDSKVKAGALNALNNLSMNLQNQEQIQAFINEVLKNITESVLNSEVQLAGLRLLVNMSVTNNYHEKMVDYIPNLLNLLEAGNDTTKAPSTLTCLFDSCITRDILIRALTFSANLSENLGRAQQCDGQAHYKEDSLYAVLFEDPAALQRNLAPLILFPDTEIKEQVKRCISAERRKNS